MRAAWYEMNGRAREVLVVGEIPDPRPGPGEVRVRIHTSGVNPADVKTRQGRPLAGKRVIPHSDGAGVIDAVGEDVSHSRIGERVWIWNAQWMRPFGTAADFVTLPSAQAVPLPSSVDFAQGACFGIPLLTAIHAVKLLAPDPGQTVLVTGAASAVGHYVTQLTVHRGGTVIGTIGSAEKAAHARTAGAGATIDYKKEEVADRIKELTNGLGVSGIIDIDFSTTSKLLSLGVLAPHGTLVSYGSNHIGNVPISFRDLLARSLTIRSFMVYDLVPDDRRAALNALSTLLQSGRLTHAIGARFSLDEIVAAHETVENGKVIGNVVIDLN